MSALALKIAVQLGEGGEARNHFTIGLDSLRLSLLHKGAIDDRQHSGKEPHIQIGFGTIVAEHPQRGESNDSISKD